MIFTVHALVHALDQQAARIARQQIVPTCAPDHFDHVPTGAEEGRFEFLNDAAVAAHRAVQALQIAVDHEDQVVQFLARSERQGAQRFGFVALAIAQKGPYFAIGLGNQSPVLEITHEARLVDRGDRPQAHRYSRELPEVRHQPGMRVRRQARVIAQLMAEVFGVLFVEASLDIRARIDTRRGVTLKVDEIAG